MKATHKLSVIACAAALALCSLPTYSHAAEVEHTNSTVQHIDDNFEILSYLEKQHYHVSSMASEDIDSLRYVKIHKNIADFSENNIEKRQESIETGLNLSNNVNQNGSKQLDELKALQESVSTEFKREVARKSKIYSHTDNAIADEYNNLTESIGVLYKLEGEINEEIASLESALEENKKLLDWFEKQSKTTQHLSLRSGAAEMLATTTIGASSQQVANLWSAEQNDVQKRLGDLHFAKSNHGAWARIYGGEYKSRKLSSDFNGNFQAIQAGYDIEATSAWRIGLAASALKNKTNLDQGDSDGHLYGLTLYATYEGGHNNYLDIVGKFSKLTSDFTSQTPNGAVSGDYDTYGSGVSVEYGIRHALNSNVYLQPQIELTYGHLFSKNSEVTFTDIANKSTTHKVHHDGMNSLVGRLGLDVGHAWENGNIHARASLSHEFDGKVKNKLEWVDGTHEVENSGKSTFFNLGIGGTYSINDACYVYTNVERSFRGNVRTEWRGDLGLRWNF